MESEYGRFEWLGVERIRPNRLNPRLEFNKQALDELSDSLGIIGMIEPIVVRPRGVNYEVVVGERRYRAAQQAGLKAIPAIVRDYSDAEVLELNLAENLHREDLTAVEKGKTCLRLLDEFPEKYTSRAALARRLGFGETTVGGWISIATSLPDEAHQYIAPETSARRVPAGKVDWRTAERVSRQIEEPQRKIDTLRQLADEGIRGIRARDVVARVARAPERSVREVITEIAEEPAELPFRLSHMRSIDRGTKTQTSRKGLPTPKIKPGAIVYANIFEPRAAELRIISVERKRLGEFTEEDAQREGGYTLEEFKRVWAEIHPEGWDAATTVYVIQFEKVQEAEEAHSA